MLEFTLQFLKFHEQPLAQLASDAIEKRTRFVELKATTKNSLLKTSVFSWLIKFTTDRQTSFRMISWNILSLIIDRNTLNNYQSLVEAALNVIFSPNEAVGVVISAVDFLVTVSQIYIDEVDSDFTSEKINEEEEEEKNVEEEEEGEEPEIYDIEEVNQEAEDDGEMLNDCHEFARNQKGRKKDVNRKKPSSRNSSLNKKEKSDASLDAKSVLEALTKRGENKKKLKIPNNFFLSTKLIFFKIIIKRDFIAL